MAKPYKIKRQLTNWEKHLQIYITNKWSLTLMYEKPLTTKGPKAPEKGEKKGRDT